LDHSHVIASVSNSGHDGSSDLFEFFSDKCLLGGQASTADDSWCFAGYFEEEGGVVGIEDVGECGAIDK
jgi:hypothetical protein